MWHRFFVAGLLLCIAGTLLASEVVEQIPGDIDRDGDVDFDDFRTLAQNFGKSGPPPTDPEPVVVVVRDTITTTVRDTVEIETVFPVIVRDTVAIETTVTVRDTIETTQTVYIEEEVSPRLQRAKRLLGFWTFYWSGSGLDFKDGFCFGLLEETSPDLELAVWGVSNLTLRILAAWNKKYQTYSLAYKLKGGGPTYLYTFSLTQDDKISGSVYLVEEGYDVVKLGDFSSESGRDRGEAFTYYGISKPALRKNLEPVGKAPAEIIALYRDLESRFVEAGIWK